MRKDEALTLAVTVFAAIALFIAYYPLASPSGQFQAIPTLPVSRADLVATSFSTYPVGNVTNGQYVNITVKFKNSGDAAAYNFATIVSDTTTSAVLINGSTTVLQPGQEGQISGTWRVSTMLGTHKLKAFVDANSNVPESNENNNIIYLYVNVVSSAPRPPIRIV